MTIRYARGGDYHIAYDVLGDGPFDLLHLTGFLLPVDALDEEPHVARYYRRLASFSRVLHFDPRGVGTSDPPGPEGNTVTSAVDEAIVVLDNVGSEQAAVVAWGASAPIAVALAARSRTGCRRWFSVTRTPA